METDAMDKEAGTAGKSEDKNVSLQPAAKETVPEGGHDELLPVIAPTLLDAPQEKTEKPLPPPSAAKFKTVEALAQAVSSLYSGNAVAEAAKVPSAPPAPKEPAAPEAPPLSAPNPLKRSEREMGVGEEPVREKMPPPALSSIKEDDGGQDMLPRVRTYANDISAEIRKRNTTLTSIVGAEQQRTMAEGPYEDTAAIARRTNRMWLFLGGALLLIVVGTISVGAAFILNKPEDVSAPARLLIPANRSVTIEHQPDEPLPATLKDAKESAMLNLGEVEAFIVTQNGLPLDTATLLELFGAPSALVRNATGSMVGIHAFDHNQPFLLITVAAYDHAFEAMLSWETRMNEGLGDFFRPASLAPSGITSAPPALTFTDRTINNIDIRESQREWHIMYTFLRPDLILITTNESTLREVVTRLSLQSSR